MHDPAGIIILLVTGIFCVIGFFHYRGRRRSIIENGIEVRGIIYEIEDISYNDEMIHPTIRFVTKEGLCIAEKADSTYPGLKVGKEVTVIYNSNSPKEFIYKMPFNWPDIVSYLVFFAGIVCTCLGFWFAYKYLTH
jgi:hypothetical protein